MPPEYLLQSSGLPFAADDIIFAEGTRTTKEVAYVIAGRLIQHYQDFCLSKGIDSTRFESVRPHDDTTLFCSAGMQQYKPLFSDPSYIGTVANSQACLRMGDLDEIGDGTHFLHFTMLGLFSFREMSVGDAINFWIEFLGTLGLVPDHVTIHPDRLITPISSRRSNVSSGYAPSICVFATNIPTCLRNGGSTLTVSTSPICGRAWTSSNGQGLPQ